MKILFDQGVPEDLRHALAPHEVTTSHERGWEALENGELLRHAQTEFDVLLTTDSNITSQQVVAKYRIALVVLRAFQLDLERYLPLVPEILAKLAVIKPGEAKFVYEDERLRRRDERKGKGNR